MTHSALSPLERYRRGRRNSTYAAELISLLVFLTWAEYYQGGYVKLRLAQHTWLMELVTSARWTLYLIEDLHSPVQALSVWARTVKPAAYQEVLAAVLQVGDCNDWLNAGQAELMAPLIARYVEMLLRGTSSDERQVLLARIFPPA